MVNDIVRTIDIVISGKLLSKIRTFICAYLYGRSGRLLTETLSTTYTLQVS